MRAEAVVELPVPAFAQQMLVQIAEHAREAVGILDIPFTLARAQAQLVVEALLAARDAAGEDALRAQALKLADDLRAIGADHRDLGGFGLEGRDLQRLALAALHAQHAERIAMLAADDRLDVGERHRDGGPCRAHASSPARSSERPCSGMPTHAGRFPSS
jgi:hypothetical protein